VSSRQYKENIHALTLEDAAAALAELEPVRFNYTAEKGEERLGFIAEDVPDLVASADRNGLSAMEMVAVLVKVVRAQQDSIRELKDEIETIKKRVD